MQNPGEILLYQTEDGHSRIDVRLVNETVWLSAGQMADLFQRDKSTISRHIQNVFEENELDRSAVVAFYATTAADGKTYQVEHFNLDVVISVGYRVKSHRGAPNWGGELSPGLSEAMPRERSHPNDMRPNGARDRPDFSQNDHFEKILDMVRNLQN